LKAVSLIKLFI